MQVILNKDVAKLGYRGDVVKVRSGYFRNYLLPSGFASLATEDVLAVYQQRLEKRRMEREKLVENAQGVVEKLAEILITLKEKANAKGKLYAAVTEQEVLESIEKAANVKLERDMLEMEHIKEVGTFEVKVVLAPEVVTAVKVVVEAL